jgi:YegS/Rv2252/BmrU family lipid kinase
VITGTIVMQRRFIINPNAAKGRHGRAVAGARRFFVERTGAFDAIVTRSRDDTIDQTRRALREGIGQIVAVGGDGTINAVINGFMAEPEQVRAGACVAIAPFGTGSDYFRTITIGHAKIDWREVVLRPAVRAVDVGRVELSEAGRVTYFINMLGAGASAVMAAGKQARPRWTPSVLAYVIPLLQQVLRPRAWPASIHIDGSIMDLELLAAVVAKGQFAGGGMRVGGGSLDDGAFGIALVPRMRRWRMLKALPGLWSGGLARGEEVRTLDGRQVTIAGDEPIPVEVDGEVMGVTPVTVSVVPRAVRICFPQ